MFNPTCVSLYKYSQAKLPPDDKIVPHKKFFRILRETLEKYEDQASGNTCQLAPLTYLDAAW